MSERASRFIYRGVWGVLTGWLLVPREPPTLPAYATQGQGPDTARERGFGPAQGYLRYLRFWFWMLLWPMDLAIVVAWIVILVVEPVVAAWLFVPALVVAVVPDIFAFIVLHLKYDTLWYVITDRSLHIRRGVLIIHETTITFENIQNVSVVQGPVQRRFGIADLTVQTAGGGGGAAPGHAAAGGHTGLIQGIADAPAVRDMILAKVKASRGAGLGDERGRESAGAPPHITPAPEWSGEHVAALREILAEARALRA